MWQFFILTIFLKFFSFFNGQSCGYLYLTASPYLELNWDFTCEDLPDTIALTLYDLTTNPDAVILTSISPGSVTRGYHLTNYSMENVELPGGWETANGNQDLTARCFDYYIASIKDGNVQDSRCFSIQPTWMENFGELRIGNMLIPGTHNSGAYNTTVAEIIAKWTITQDKAFWKQLVYGIRYFDIRIGIYEEPPEGIFINHGLVQCTELLPELQSVADFLSKSSKEVVILNFHSFEFPEDFTHEFHQEVLDLVWDVLGSYIVPYSNTHTDGPQLQEFWNSGKRVIISYAEDSIVEENSWLWPTVTRYWGDVEILDQLEAYVKYQISTRPRGNPMSVIMAELTPSAAYIAEHLLDQDLKYMAAIVNRDLAHWVREDNGLDNANIIATDFCVGNDIMNVAIEANTKKLNKHNH